MKSKDESFKHVRIRLPEAIAVPADHGRIRLSGLLWALLSRQEVLSQYPITLDMVEFVKEGGCQ